MQVAPEADHHRVQNRQCGLDKQEFYRLCPHPVLVRELDTLIFAPIERMLHVSRTEETLFKKNPKPNISFCFALFCGVPSLFGLLRECFQLFQPVFPDCVPQCSGFLLKCFLLFLAIFCSVSVFSSHILECSPLVTVVFTVTEDENKTWV